MDWYDEAGCRTLNGIDPCAVFFPENGSVKFKLLMRKTCAGCGVQPQCLEYALSFTELFGCWGGLTKRELNCYRELIQNNSNISIGEIIDEVSFVGCRGRRKRGKPEQISVFIRRHQRWLSNRALAIVS